MQAITGFKLLKFGSNAPLPPTSPTSASSTNPSSIASSSPPPTNSSNPSNSSSPLNSCNPSGSSNSSSPLNSPHIPSNSPTSPSPLISPPPPSSRHPSNIRFAAINTGAPRYTGVIVEDLLLFNNLVYLDVSNNKLRISDFAVLPSLQELRISNNQISKIDCPPSGFKKLKKLDLSNNALSENALIKLGTHFQKLIYLNLSNNHLTVLPKEICNLQTLETLLLDNNECSNTQLSLLGFLPRLYALSFNNNKVTKYLHHSGIFSSLIDLFLNQNLLATLQDLTDLTKLSSLRNVHVRGNPLRREELVECITMPSFYEPSKRNIQFIIGAKVPTKQKRKKKTRQKIIESSTQEEDFEDSLFLTSVDITETMPTHRSARKINETEDFSNDWIPDFIIAELCGQVSSKLPPASQQVLNALRSTVQHPPTLHMPSQKGGKSKRITNRMSTQEAPAQETHIRSNMSSGQSNRSIANLSEAEDELAKMKQRLYEAEQNFANVLNLADGSIS